MSHDALKFCMLIDLSSYVQGIVAVAGPCRRQLIYLVIVLNVAG